MQDSQFIKLLVKGYDLRHEGVQPEDKNTAKPGRDVAGNAGGGVVSNKIMSVMKFTQGSSSVYIEGDPVVRITSQTAHNGTPPNAPLGTQLSPNQNKVMVIK